MTDEFREEAGIWWNTRAHPALKMLVVSAAYYEHLAHDVVHADDYLKEVTDEMD
jgi:transposase